MNILFEIICTRARYFDIGLDFSEIAICELTKHKEEIKDWTYRQYIEHFIHFKLKMLDYKNEWRDYLDYTKWAIENIKYPYILNFTRPVNTRYIYLQNNQEYTHFLYLCSDRYEIIKRKWTRWISGKSVEHLKRHQQEEMSEEYIKYCIETVTDFFALAHYNL